MPTAGVPTGGRTCRPCRRSTNSCATRCPQRSRGSVQSRTARKAISDSATNGVTIGSLRRLMSRLPVLSIVLLGLAVTGAGTAGCVNPLTALPKLFEARRLASELHVAFTRAAEASNRAVMADTDEASIAAKDEATAARQVVDHDL